MRRSGALLVLTLLLLTGCRQIAERAQEPPPEDRGPCSFEGGIPRAVAAVGDIDGDGGADRVAAVEAEGDEDCRYALAATTADAVLTAPLFEPGFTSEERPPRVRGLADVDRDGTSEIVVDVYAGAAAEFLAVYKVSDGHLRRLRPSGRLAQAIPAFAFGHGGSVGNLAAVDCWDGTQGAVVATVAAPSNEDAERYDVTRRFYRVDGRILNETGTDTFQIDAVRLGRLPEYEASPFGSCPSG